jgi:APA family basic amino acid/polyamine antiporter
MSQPLQDHSAGLARVVGVPGAVFMGIGSILGTGIFVSVGLAAGIAGPAVVLAAVLAASVARTGSTPCWSSSP